MIVGKYITASLFYFFRIVLLLIIFHLISSDQPTYGANILSSDSIVVERVHNSPTMELAFTTVSSSCSNSDDGSIDVLVSGGVEPFAFLWSDGSIAEDLLLVKAGVYSVQVTDANGISITGTAEIEAPEQFTLNANVVNFMDPSFKGSIEIQLSGGTAPYTYSWSNGENVNMLTDLNPGVYSVTYTDINGCSGMFNSEIYLLSDVHSSSYIELEHATPQKRN